MPRPHSIRAGSRAQGLPRVSALGKACLSHFAMDLAKFFRTKEQSNVREPASPPGKPLQGKGQPVRSKRDMGVQGRGLSFTGTLFAFEQNDLFEHDCHLGG